MVGFVAVPPMDNVPVEPLWVTVPAETDCTSAGKWTSRIGLVSVPVLETYPPPAVAL